MKIKKNNISIRIFFPIIAGFTVFATVSVLLIFDLHEDRTTALQGVSSARAIVKLAAQLEELNDQVIRFMDSYRTSLGVSDLKASRQADVDALKLVGESSQNVDPANVGEAIDEYLYSKKKAIEERQNLVAAIASSSPERIQQAYAAWAVQANAAGAAVSKLAASGSSFLDRSIVDLRVISDRVLANFLLLLAALAILTALLYFYLKRLVVNPINQLTIGARRVAEGNLEWNIKASSLDEIGELSQAFNEMTKKLNDSYVNLQTLAFSDPLTGLPNRQSLEKKLQVAIEATKQQQRLLGLVMLDLDRFKKINDTLGHDVGDKVLKEVVTRLVSVLRPDDTVVRLGGDEFIILLPGLKAAFNAITVANKILKSFEEAMVIDGHGLYVSGSLGIALYPNDAEDLSGLLKAADIALYGAKGGGRNRYNLYNKTTDLRLAAQLELENDLHNALKNDQLKVFYQPLINFQTGKLTCTEVLLRWQHPSLGLLLPHEFIPLAEECGMINDIGQWVLKTSCSQGKEWEDKGLTGFRLAVNLSPNQFMEDDLVGNITDVLKVTGFPADRLTLEITENLAMSNVELSKQRLKTLSGMGIAISIDDFGIGYSSLSSLKEFPVHKLKIDSSFIRHIITDPQDTAIVKAIITVGHNLNLSVAAEGVESDTQMALLKSLGCDEAQGFFISRPLIGKDFEGWLVSERQQQPAEPAPVAADGDQAAALEENKETSN